MGKIVLYEFWRKRMIFKRFFRKKIRKNLAFFIVFNPPIKYPTESERKIYFSQLRPVFNEFFEEFTIHWYKNEKGKLDLITVVCFGPKFSYEESKEFPILHFLVSKIEFLLNQIFEKNGTKCSIEDVKEVVFKNAEEYAKNLADKGLRLDDSFFREVNFAKEIDYFVIECKKDKALDMAKDFYKENKSTLKEIRINPKHPNVIERKINSKWVPIVVFIDSKIKYTPKLGKEKLIRLT